MNFDYSKTMQIVEKLSSQFVGTSGRVARILSNLRAANFYSPPEANLSRFSTAWCILGYKLTGQLSDYSPALR